MARTAPEPITTRPLPVIDLIDGAFHAIRQRPRTLLGLTLCFAMPLTLWEVYLDTVLWGDGLPWRDGVLGSDDGRSDEALVTIGGGELLGGGSGITNELIDRLGNWWVTAVIGVAVARIVGGWTVGHDAGIGDALRFCLRQLPAIAAVFLLGRVLVAVGLLLAVIPGILAVLWFSLASPVLALEPLRNPWLVLKRSRSLVATNWGAVVRLILLVVFSTVGLSLSLEAIANEFLSLFQQGRPLAFALETFLILLTHVVILSFNGAAMTLLYLDSRFRSEGLDLELRAGKAFHGD